MQHSNTQYPSDAARFNGEPRYNASPVSEVHGHAPRHIIAPRVDRAANPNPRSNFRESGTVVSHRRPSVPARTFEAKGHDAALAHCQNYAQPVSIQTLNSSAKVTGIIVRRDRFTVTLEREGASNGLVYHEIIFKHAIESISLPEFAKAAVQ